MNAKDRPKITMTLFLTKRRLNERVAAHACEHASCMADERV